MTTTDRQPTGPDETDVRALTDLLDLMSDFPSNEQRARYLLTSNWFVGEGVSAAVWARVSGAVFRERMAAQS